jgi:ribosome-binding protein aMBF1 (putative translation factor)
MQAHLDLLDLDIEIYEYDPFAPYDLYERIKEKVVGFNAEELSQAIKTRKDICDRIIEAFSRPDIVQLNQIGRIRGIGIKTLEKVFSWANEPRQSIQGNLSL